MKSTLRARFVHVCRFVALMWVCQLWFGSPAEAQRATQQRIAVLELKSFNALEVAQLMSLSDQLRAEAQRTLGDDFIIMSRENISVLLEDPEVSEACTSNCELKVGRAIQAHYVLSGSVRSVEGVLKASLRLHRVRDDRSMGVEAATASDEDELAEALKKATGLLLLQLSSSTGDGGEGVVASAQLKEDPLPAFKELTVVSRFGIPTALMVQYDEALRVDEDEDETVERKILLWSRLAVYTQYERLAQQAKGRASYWRKRYLRRIACDKTWRELRPVMELSRAVSEADREQTAVEFLNECGRDPRENPHVKHPTLRAQLEREAEVRREKERARRAKEEAKEEEERERLRAERKAKREKERARRAKEEAEEEEERERRRAERKAKREQEQAEEKAEALRLKREKETKERVEELSPLELWVGVSHGVKAEGLSYHLKTRVQLEDALERSLFLDAFAVLSQAPDEIGGVLDDELGVALGYQHWNWTRWAPSASLGYMQVAGAHYMVGELGLRYVRVPGWLGFGLSLQYLKGFGLEQTTAEELSEANPAGPLDGARSYIPRLDQLNGELRVTLWADTGLKGVVLGALAFYLLSAMDL